MAEAAAIGIQPQAFLDMTPRELRACFDGAEKRRLRDAQLALYNAWHAGAFARYNPKKKLPDLSQMLDKLGGHKEMSPTELRRAILNWHNQMSGSVRVVPKGSLGRS